LTLPDQEEPEALDYTPQFDFALDTTEKQLRIARILVP
jgi:hypothetical protein